MSAAVSAANSGHEAVIIERNEKTGKKLFITGKGRCNLTNATAPAAFLNNVVSNRKFMTGAIYAFTPEDTVRFFEERGLKLKTERGGRVFPESDKSSDVAAVLNSAIKEAGVRVLLNEKALFFSVENRKITSIKTDKSVYNDVGAVVLATGGKSYPSTGSDGSGYKLAASAGHTVVPPVPALSPVNLVGAYGAKGELFPRENVAFPEGLTLKNVRIRAVNEGKTLFSDFGEMLFTSKGVSGPIVLSASSVINRLPPEGLKIVVDLKPALDEKTLDARLQRDFAETRNKQFKNSLGELLPSSLIPYIVALSGVEPSKPMNSVTKAERAALLKLLKELTFKVEGLAPIEGAIVTAGGVSADEIDPKTMRSKLIDNLYFAGEVIDVDGFTGGYNIQIALSTGFVAGKVREK